MLAVYHCFIPIFHSFLRRGQLNSISLFLYIYFVSSYLFLVRLQLCHVQRRHSRHGNGLSITYFQAEFSVLQCEHKKAIKDAQGIQQLHVNKYHNKNSTIHCKFNSNYNGKSNNKITSNTQINFGQNDFTKQWNWRFWELIAFLMCLNYSAYIR